MLFVPCALMLIQLPPPATWFFKSTWRSSDRRDDDVEFAIVVEVGDGEPSTDAFDLQRRTRLSRDVAELAADVLVQQILFRVRQVGLIQLDVVHDVTVGDVNVQVTVVVHVVELGTEAERDEAGTQTGLRRYVLEQALAEVGVERVQLFGEVGDEEIRETIAVDITAIDAHTRLRLTVGVEADTRGVGNVGERAVAVVAVQEVPHHVVGDVDVGVPVTIVVAERDAETLAGRVGDAGLLRDVRKRPVPVVPVQPIGHPVEHRRMAVHAVSVFLQAAIRVFGYAEVQVVGDVEIEVSVAIEVEEARARAPLRRRPGHPSCGSDIAEGAVAVVLVEEVRAKAGHVQIEIAVAVVVANRNAGFVGGLAGAASVRPRLRCDVRERAVVIVVIERVCRAWCAVDEIQILEPVVVVVDPGDPRAERFNHVLLR